LKGGKYCEFQVAMMPWTQVWKPVGATGTVVVVHTRRLPRGGGKEELHGDATV